MLYWTLRDLFAAPFQLVASVAAVAGALALVLFFEGVFAGESEQIVALIDRTEADVWVMQKGVGNMHLASSYLADWKVDTIADVEGVAKVTPILYLHSVIEAGDRRWFSFVVGIEEGDPRAGPWRPAGGAQLPGPGTAIVPDIFASDAGLEIGDPVRVAGHDFAIAGFSAETFSMAHSITYVTMSDLAESLSSVGTVSYVMVDAAPGIDTGALADRIMEQVEDVNALTRQVFSDRDYSIAVQMGLEIVWIMTVIGGAMAALLTAFVVYSNVADRERELAVMKALGVRSRAIYASMLLHAFTIGVLSFLAAVGITLAAIPLTEHLVPKVSLAITGTSLLRTGATAVVVSLIAAAIPVRRVVSVDPITAFQR